MQVDEKGNLSIVDTDLLRQAKHQEVKVTPENLAELRNFANPKCKKGCYGRGYTGRFLPEGNRPSLIRICECVDWDGFMEAVNNVKYHTCDKTGK